MRPAWRKALGGLLAAIVVAAAVCMVAMAGHSRGGEELMVPAPLPETSIGQNPPSAVASQPPMILPTPAEHPDAETRFLRQPKWLENGDCSVLEGPYLV